MTDPREELALWDRLQELRRQEETASVYQRGFRAFLRDYVWTQDEARGGRIAQMPDAPFLDEVADALIEEPLLLIEKSRRVLMSWTLSAFVVWLAAGGQDERWPALMQSAGNRQIIWASRKLHDITGSAWFLRERAKFIHDHAILNGIRDVWPAFPDATWTFSEGRYSNGSRINAVPQGPDQMAGAGATLIVGDEAAFWPNAKAAVSRAKPVTQGGGHLILNTTPQAGTYASDIRHGRLATI